jgi:non-heme chloroperoxidase
MASLVSGNGFVVIRGASAGRRAGCRGTPLARIVLRLGVDPSGRSTAKEDAMPEITTKDGAQIFFKDWGAGRPIVFSHGWPLNADAWDDELLFLANNGFRVIAHDRRGHGRSTQSWSGNTMDTYADDLAAVMDKLELREATLVGHSTGGGEITRYVGRHGTARVKQMVLIGAIPPLMLKTASNPLGTPLAAFDEIRAGLLKDRSQYYRELSAPFYGANRAGSKVSDGVLEQFWLYCMQVGLKASYDCVKQFSETDLTDDLKEFDVPTLIIHGADDQIVPIDAAGRASAKMIKGSVFKVYPGAPHGLFVTHKEQLHADLLAFVKG